MVEQFYQKGIEFLQRLFAEIELSAIDLSTWDIDHICYRTETVDRYHQLKEELKTIGTLLIESEVNGRPISTFELFKPLEWQHRSIHLVELPAPKPSKPTPEGFEHIEVITPLPLEELQNQYSELKLDSRGLTKAFNRELEIELQSGALKFHNLSLASVVEFEKNQKIFSAIVRSQILTFLRPYGPLVAGTFPLGVTTEKSDVDILCATMDPVDLKLQLEKIYSSQEEFQAHYKLRAGKPVLVVRFKFDGVPFEIFAQEVPSVMQTGYRHFLVEERFLKLGRKKFKEAVMSLRQEGKKTEAAFASALQLTGDPYVSLLAFENANESELKLALHQAGF